MNGIEIFSLGMVVQLCDEITVEWEITTDAQTQPENEIVEFYIILTLEHILSKNLV